MDESLNPLRGALIALMQWIEDAGLRAAIIGGVAASLRGKPRLTKDIDALVLERSAEELVESGARFGFEPRLAGAVEFAQRSRVLLLRHGPGAIDIDISLGGLPFEEEVVGRSTLFGIGAGAHVRIATAEDLVIMKAVAGRPRDVMDIESILEANPDLEIERIRHWVREFSAILDMPEMHENLERLLKGRSERDG